jgi:hypothetical protein
MKITRTDSNKNFFDFLNVSSDLLMKIFVSGRNSLGGLKLIQRRVGKLLAE